jgi:multidrug resistance efflux pump
VLSLASDGLKVLQIDTTRYQEKIEKLENQIKSEVRKRMKAEEQINISRGNSLYELSRGD